MRRRGFLKSIAAAVVGAVIPGSKAPLRGLAQPPRLVFTNDSHWLYVRMVRTCAGMEQFEIAAHGVDGSRRQDIEVKDEW